MQSHAQARQLIANRVFARISRSVGRKHIAPNPPMQPFYNPPNLADYPPHVLEKLHGCVGGLECGLKGEALQKASWFLPNKTPTDVAKYPSVCVDE